MTFLDFARKTLEFAKKPLSPLEMWKIGEENGFTKELNSKGKTPWETLSARIYCEIRDNSQATIFSKIDGKTLFFLKDVTPEKNVKLFELEPEKIVPEKTLTLLEYELHKYLVYFLYKDFNIYAKTISAQKSSKTTRNYDKWRHPDLVGVYFPVWEQEIIEFSKDVGNFGLKLFSYEVKREINNTNLREVYFQAVSNSSWANEGYLVANEVPSDALFYEEFKRLNNSFGIGLIKISTEDPSDSKIIFQASPKEYVDIETMNVLAKINSDFSVFMNSIQIDYSKGNKSKEKYGKYDPRIDVEELYK